MWGYRTAATVSTWVVVRQPGKGGAWTLQATLARADAFQCRQRPLYFTAPHHKGIWCWPIASLTIANKSLTAALRAPEQ